MACVDCVCWDTGLIGAGIGVLNGGAWTWAFKEFVIADVSGNSNSGTVNSSPSKLIFLLDEITLFIKGRAIEKGFSISTPSF